MSCASKCLDIIVKLNENRLYGRLGSGKYCPPKYRRGKPDEPLSKNLQYLSKRLTALPLGELSTTKQGIDDQIQSLTTLFEQTEKKPLGYGDHTILKTFVKKTHAVCMEAQILLARLRTNASIYNLADDKHFKQLLKFANYYRIADDLSRMARSFRGLFIHVLPHYLEAFSSLSWHGRPRYVHAEVQLVTHFEVSQSRNRPRVIGASKEACFLCDAFVEAQGDFQLSKAHRQLYEKWTIPDLSEYSAATRERLRTTIFLINQAVERELRQSKIRRVKRKHPMQSSANVVPQQIRSASRSTIRSRVRSRDSNLDTRDLDRNFLVPVNEHSVNPIIIVDSHPPKTCEAEEIEARPNEAQVDQQTPVLGSTGIEEGRNDNPDQKERTSGLDAVGGSSQRGSSSPSEMKPLPASNNTFKSKASIVASPEPTQPEDPLPSPIGVEAPTIPASDKPRKRHRHRRDHRHQRCEVCDSRERHRRRKRDLRRRSYAASRPSNRNERRKEHTRRVPYDTRSRRDKSLKVVTVRRNRKESQGRSCSLPWLLQICKRLFWPCCGLE